MKAEAADTPRYLEYVLGLTAFAAGPVDIISFTKLGGIFASAMTGNLAFLALYLARGSVTAAIGSAIALVGFMAGGAAGTLLCRGMHRNESLKILLESEVILLALFLVAGLALPHAIGSLTNYVLITLLSVAMGLQSILGKKINLSNIPTIVFTSTLTNIVIALTEMIASGNLHLPKDTGRQMMSFILYFTGALCAGFLVYLKSSAVLALPLVAVAVAFLILRSRHSEKIEHDRI
jgi:uncharacterized membrane protein YoaK (UPF0700 family)